MKPTCGGTQRRCYVWIAISGFAVHHGHAFVVFTDKFTPASLQSARRVIDALWIAVSETGAVARAFHKVRPTACSLPSLPIGDRASQKP